MGEMLILYLSTSKEVISAILLVERDKNQVPVYFITRLLQGAEMNYSIVEKLVLFLVYAVRRLRRYFQANLILVLTNQPMKQILMQPKWSGRMKKWAIELG